MSIFLRFACGSFLALLAPEMVEADSAAGVSAETPEQFEFQIEPTSPVFASKGEVAISDWDLEAYLQNRVPEEHRSQFLSDPGRIGHMIENIMLPRQIAAVAIEEGLLDNPSIQGMLAQAAVTLISDEYLDAYLEENQLDDYSALAREMVLTDPMRFTEPQRIDFSHILFTPEERGETEMMRRILEAVDRLDQGEDFNEVAVSLSDDPSVGENSGRFEDVSPSDLNQQFVEALVQLEPEEVSEPVLTQFGWHVIKLHRIHDIETPTFEEVREEAIQLAKQRHLQQLEERFFSSLTSQELVIEEGAVARFLRRHGITDQGG